MKNILRLIDDLAKRGVINGCSKGIIVNFFRQMSRPHDISDQDVVRIADYISSGAYEAAGKISDQLLDGEYKDKMPHLLQDAAMAIGTNVCDMNRIMIIYVKVGETIARAKAN